MCQMGFKLGSTKACFEWDLFDCSKLALVLGESGAIKLSKDVILVEVITKTKEGT